MPDIGGLPISATQRAAFERGQKAIAHLDRAVKAAQLNFEETMTALKERKRERSAMDKLEEQSMRHSAMAAAASGTPALAKALLAKVRGRIMQAAADGADTAALEAMARDLQRLAKIAAQNEEREQRDEARRAAASSTP